MSNDQGIMGLVDRIRDLETENQFLRAANEKLTVQLDEIMENLSPQDFSMGTHQGRGYFLPKGWLKKVVVRLPGGGVELRAFGPSESMKRLHRELAQELADRVLLQPIGGENVDRASTYGGRPPGTPFVSVYVVTQPGGPAEEAFLGERNVAVMPDKD